MPYRKEPQGTWPRRHVYNDKLNVVNMIIIFKLCLQENCVAIRMWKGHEGKWADVDCNQNFGSVCQAKQGKQYIRNCW